MGDLSVELAGPDEMGSEWGRHGTDWSWAHNGVKQNGWFRLCAGEHLMSKWGPGSWHLLREADGGAADGTPLLLAAFGGVEHALRLMPHDGEKVRFDCVCLR